MAEKKKIPEIRFKGFSEEWKENKLGELVQIKDSARIPNEIWAESGVRYLRSSDLENSGLDGKLFISIDAYEDYKSKTGAPENGDVLFNSGGNIGLSLLKTDNTPLYVQGGAILYVRTSKSKDVDGGYLSVYFSTPRMIKYIDISSAGGTIKHFTLKPANAAPFIFPNVIEQREVSEFFQNLDKLITLHQAKYTKLVNIKKAMLEKMFPQKGAVVPEIRFKGFTEDWEEKELGEIVKITMGQSPNGENYTDNPEDYILVQGNADMKNGKVVPRVWTKQVTKIADAEDLIMSVRAPVGEVGKTAYNVVIGRGVAAIKANEFIFQSLKRMNEIGYWKQFSAGSTFDSINSNDLSKALISTTEEKEQSKIGTLFKHLDNLITLQQRELEKLKNIKKACLGKMFV